LFFHPNFSFLVPFYTYIFLILILLYFFPFHLPPPPTFQRERKGRKKLSVFQKSISIYQLDLIYINFYLKERELSWTPTELNVT
jgi:hypothetical protein